MTTASPEIEFIETGNGTPVLFVPGSYSTSAAWRGIWEHMPADYRFAATSLCGYGKTAETRNDTDLAMTHEVDVIAEAARRLGGNVHLVGHSFGGTIALASAISGAAHVLSIATFEANPLWLANQCGHGDLFQETRALADDFLEALDNGDPDAAKLIIDFWGGAGAFDAFPDPVRDFCRATAPSNALDWKTAFDFQPQPADYAAITAPVLLVEGGLANPMMQATTRILSETLPDSRTATVDGAGHFLIASHPKQCAALLTAFLAVIST